MIIAATGTDKVRLDDNKPTSITSTQSSDAALQAVMDKCFALGSEQGQAIKQANVVSTQSNSKEGVVAGSKGVVVANQKTKSGTKKSKTKQ